MPCQSGSAGCVTKTASDQVGVLPGYNATAGYDLTTGLGSVNVANLVNNWNLVSFQPTVSTLSLMPTAQVVHGSPVSLNITVAPKAGTGTPTGLVSLNTSRGPTAGTFTLNNGSVSGATGTLPGGSYVVTAHYAGDGTYAASDSTPVPVTIVAEPSTTTVQAFTLDQYWNATPFTGGSYGTGTVYLRASVAAHSAQGVPSGMVNFTQTVNGATTNLSGDPYSLNSEGYTMTPLPLSYVFFTPGTYSIAASYTGDSSFNASSSAPVNFTITKAPTTTTPTIDPCSSITGPCVVPSGVPVSMWFSVPSNTLPPAGNPTGTITIYSNGTPLAAPITVDSSVAPPAIYWATTQLPLGLNNITAQYSGDSNFSASTSPSTLIDVGGTFSISANPSTINIASPGQSGSTTLSFTAQNGLNGSGTLSAASCSNLPSQTACSFSPSTVTLTGSTTSVPVMLTLSTTAPSSVAHAVMKRQARWVFRNTAGFVLLCVGIILVDTRRNHRWKVLTAFLSLLILVFTMSCGGGNASGSGGNGGGPGSGGSGGGGNSGTPVGSYSGVTVTATIDGITQFANVNVSIQ